MRYKHNLHPHWIVAPAARLALRFASRRGAKRRDAWHPLALLWRRKRKGPESVHATRLVPTAGAVSLAQFHLHFFLRENGSAARHSTHGLPPVAVSHRTRVVMEHRRTIIQARMDLAQLPRAQFTVQVSARHHGQSGSGTKFQTTAQYPKSARQPIIPAITSRHHGESGSRTKFQTTAQYPKSARQPIAPAITSWGTVRTRSLNPRQTRLRVQPGKSMDGNDHTFQLVQTYPIEPQLFRSRSAVLRHSSPPHSEERPPAQLDFQPQNLVWRHALQPTAENTGHRRQWNLDTLEEQSHGRSFTGTGAASGTSQPSGHVPATPVMKLDSALMDRMADDVIRRLERRARIERARQGL